MAINRLDHTSLFVPDFGKALTWYADLLGMKVLENTVDQVHLSCRGEVADLTLAKRPKAGLRDFTFGVDDPGDLDRMAKVLAHENVAFDRASGGMRPGEDETLTFTAPSGHIMRMAVGAKGRRAGITNMVSDGTHAPCGIDHINIIGEVDPQIMREFLQKIGFKFSFSIAMHGNLLAAWLRSSAYDHDLAYTRAARPTDRLHHVAFAVEDGNHYFRLSDRLMEHRMRWEFGPGRHNVGFGPSTGFGTNNYAYILDPAGNRNEFCSGMDLMADDAPPRVLDIVPDQLGDVMNGWGHGHPESMMFGS
jgi:catechol 2,3-dioxygenase